MRWIPPTARRLRYTLLAVALLPSLLCAAIEDQSDISLPPQGMESVESSFFTYKPEQIRYPARDSWWLDTSDWVIKQRHRRSDQVQRVGAWADRTLSGDAEALPDNESYLRLGFATRSETGDLAQLEPEARFRLDLPTLEEKLRLVVESESEETKSLSERDRDRQLTDNERADSGTTGALRYITQLTETLNLSNDVGARLRFPPDAFWRARSRASFRLQDNWQMDIDQRFYYFHVDGWGESTWLGFSRPYGEWQFLSESELRWVHKDRNFEFSHVLSLYNRLNNRAELNPRAGIIGESNPNWRTTEFLVDATYRYRIYDSWLFGEIIPAINFYRDDNFKETTSLTLRIEMFFARSIR